VSRPEVDTTPGVVVRDSDAGDVVGDLSVIDDQFALNAR
jgi:hypothetical protein